MDPDDAKRRECLGRLKETQFSQCTRLKNSTNNRRFVRESDASHRHYDRVPNCKGLSETPLSRIFPANIVPRGLREGQSLSMRKEKKTQFSQCQDSGSRYKTVYSCPRDWRLSTQSYTCPIKETLPETPQTITALYLFEKALNWSPVMPANGKIVFPAKIRALDTGSLRVSVNVSGRAQPGCKIIHARTLFRIT